MTKINKIRRNNKDRIELCFVGWKFPFCRARLCAEMVPLNYHQNKLQKIKRRWWWCNKDCVVEFKSVKLLTAADVSLIRWHRPDQLRYPNCCSHRTRFHRPCLLRRTSRCRLFVLILGTRRMSLDFLLHLVCI